MNVDGTSIIDGSLNPVVAPLADNGGPTLTHLLMPGSDALDAGDPNFTSPPDTEQRGSDFGRVFDGDFDNNAVIDMGAVEMQSLPGGGVPLVVDTAVDEVDGDMSPGDFSLREALILANGSFGPDTINFSPGLHGQTITLAAGELSITEALTINGPGAELLTIDADSNSRVFNVDDGAPYFGQPVEISGLTLTGGNITVSGLEDINGGAILNDDLLTLRDMVIEGNSAEGGGGGIRSTGRLDLVDSIVTGNQAAAGGGIVGVDYILRSVISGNSAASGGGINSAGNLEIIESTISGNAANVGGGLWISSGDITILQSVISGNSAVTLGAGISLSAASLQLNHSTVTANTGAAGIEILSSAESSNIILNHAIVAANPIVDLVAPFFGDDQVQALFSLVGNRGNTFVQDFGGNQIGSPVNVIDPLLGPLDDYGGPTPTHALLAGSPAVDAGDPNYPGFLDIPLDFDQRGAPFSRVFDGDFNGSAFVDIGAYERPPMLIVDTDLDDFDGDVSPGDFSLREAVAFANGTPEADTITFDASLAGETITLGLGELPIKRSVNINGLGADQLTIAANLAIGGGSSRLFSIDDSDDGNLIDVMINDLTLAGGGNVTRGGAVSSRENLTLNRTLISGSQAVTGGGIYHTLGTLTLDSSTVASNSASLSGGGIALYGATLNVANSTISGNESDGSGGGLLGSNMNATLAHSTITNNTAGADGSLDPGGGLALTSSTVTLDHTIVAGNSGFLTSPEILGPVSARFSLIGNNVGTTITDLGGNKIGTPVTPIDALLGPLDNYGGTTPTHTPLAFPRWMTIRPPKGGPF